jgi:phosphoserine phosphatase
MEHLWNGCKEIIEKLGAPKKNIHAIGDSAVDIPVFELAGTKIAINPKGGIENNADIVLRGGSLAELVPYLQGKR